HLRTVGPACLARLDVEGHRPRPRAVSRDATLLLHRNRQHAEPPRSRSEVLRPPRSTYLDGATEWWRVLPRVRLRVRALRPQGLHQPQPQGGRPLPVAP